MVQVEQCGVTYVGLFRQVSLHKMLVCAGKQETRVVALTGRRRCNSEKCERLEYIIGKTEEKAAACTGKQNQMELAKSCFGGCCLC